MAPPSSSPPFAILLRPSCEKAFAESDMSLCAPFLAFDPVMQFIVGACVVPVTCAYLSMGCGELKGEGEGIPMYHVLSVATIASAAFALGRAGRRRRLSRCKNDGGLSRFKNDGDDSKRIKNVLLATELGRTLGFLHHRTTPSATPSPQPSPTPLHSQAQ